MLIVLGSSTLIALGVLLTIAMKRRYVTTKQEVMLLIENRLRNGMSREWDYYRLVSTSDKRMEAIRERCLMLDHLSSEEQENGFKAILDELRA